MVEASDEPIALDSVADDDLPDLPADIRLVADGFEVDGIDDHVEVTLQYGVDDVSGDKIELQHNRKPSGRYYEASPKTR